MTYNERVEATKSMTLEELLFSYHNAMDTAEEESRQHAEALAAQEQDAMRAQEAEAKSHQPPRQDYTEQHSPQPWQQEAALKTARQVEQPDTVTITCEEYDRLLASRDMLEALEAAGVDNWSCYEDAMALLEGA